MTRWSTRWIVLQIGAAFVAAMVFVGCDDDEPGSLTGSCGPLITNEPACRGPSSLPSPPHNFSDLECLNAPSGPDAECAKQYWSLVADKTAAAGKQLTAESIRAAIGEGSLDAVYRAMGAGAPNDELRELPTKLLFGKANTADEPVLAADVAKDSYHVGPIGHVFQNEELNLHFKNATFEYSATKTGTKTTAGCNSVYFDFTSDYQKAAFRPAFEDLKKVLPTEVLQSLDYFGSDGTDQKLYDHLAAGFFDDPFKGGPPQNVEFNLAPAAPCPDSVPMDPVQ